MRFSMPSKLRKLITSSFFPAKILAKAIRKNGDISDLFVKDTEFKISKYADDTTLIVNGSEKSLLEAQKTLECSVQSLRPQAQQ